MTLRAQLGSLFMPLLLHQYNASTAASRAAIAKQMGVEATGPAAPGTLYPGSAVTTTNNNNTSGWLPGALLGTGILAAGILGTTLGPGLLSKAPLSAVKATEPNTATTPHPNPPPQGGRGDAPDKATPAEGDFVKWQMQPDGSKKEIGRFHVRTLPDGTQQQRQPDGTWVPFKGVP